MKRMVFKGQFNKAVLMDELLVAFPDWVRDKQANFTMKGSDTELRLWFPEDTDEADVQSVINAHDHSLEHPAIVADRDYQNRLKEIAAKDPSDLTAEDTNFMAAAMAKRLTLPGPEVIINDENTLGSTFVPLRKADA